MGSVTEFPKIPITALDTTTEAEAERMAFLSALELHLEGGGDLTAEGQERLRALDQDPLRLALTLLLALAERLPDDLALVAWESPTSEGDDYWGAAKEVETITHLGAAMLARSCTWKDQLARALAETNERFDVASRRLAEMGILALDARRERDAAREALQQAELRLEIADEPAALRLEIAELRGELERARLLIQAYDLVTIQKVGAKTPLDLRAEAEARAAALEGLIVHAWIHEGYPVLGRSKMTTDQKELLDAVLTAAGWVYHDTEDSFIGADT